MTSGHLHSVTVARAKENEQIDMPASRRSEVSAHKVVVSDDNISLTQHRNPFHTPYADRIYPKLDDMDTYCYKNDPPVRKFSIAPGLHWSSS